MRQTAFEARHGAEWERFGHWLDRRERPKGHSDAGPMLADTDVPGLYRRVCQHLALARDRQYSPRLVERLNGLALRGHHVLYAARGAGVGRLGTFLAADFPRLVRTEWRLVAVSTLLFLAPAVVLTVAVWLDPDLALDLMSPDELAELREMYDPANDRLGVRQADTDVAMLGFYIWNNVKVGFQTFATGLAFGIGTVFYLVYNAAMSGVIAGHLTVSGLGQPFWSFVAGHSGPELTALTISGAAGLRLGTAVISPGQRTRRAALVAAARPAVGLGYGAALLFLAAAFTEAFWSPLTVFPATTKYVVGVILWGLLLSYLVLGGRGRGA